MVGRVGECIVDFSKQSWNIGEKFNKLAEQRREAAGQEN